MKLGACTFRTLLLETSFQYPIHRLARQLASKHKQHFHLALGNHQRGIRYYERLWKKREPSAD